MTPTELWNISATALHTPQYIANYIQELGSFLPSREAAILDTACGSGFPSLELYKEGYRNIICSDGDREALEIFQQEAKKENANIPVIWSSWQDLTKKVEQMFDVVLNVDNSFVYFDGWPSQKYHVSSGEEMFMRAGIILKNFYDLLNDKGTLIVGIAKNNREDVHHAVTKLEGKTWHGKSVDVVWDMYYDWEKRIKNWTALTEVEGELHRLEGQSYLITKEELANLFEQTGLQNVIIKESGEAYENFIIGQR